MDKGMKKVVNLVTNYMSALCETGRHPGRVHRNIKAGTAVYFPVGGLGGVERIEGDVSSCSDILPGCVNVGLEREIRAARHRNVY